MAIGRALTEELYLQDRPRAVLDRLGPLLDVVVGSGGVRAVGVQVVLPT